MAKTGFFQNSGSTATTENDIDTQVTLAQTAATNAQNSETAAETAQAASETAQAASESARDIATSKAGLANASAVSAATSASNASSAVSTKFGAIQTTTTTGAAGSSAAVSYTDSTTTFDFTVPQGATGDTGATGSQGIQGIQGAQGIQGVAGNDGADGSDGAAATIAVGSVTTGAAGSSATVTNAGSSSAATFNFSIPRGDTGATGSQGIQGVAGADGADGADGTTLSNLTDVTGGVEVTSNLTLTSTADSGAVLKLISNDPADAADFGIEGVVQFYAENDASESTLYYSMQLQTADVSDGFEDGWLYLNSKKDGTLNVANAFGSDGSMYILGSGNGAEGALKWFQTKGTSHTVSVKPNTPTASRNIFLPDASGTVALNESGILNLTNSGSQSELRLYCESGNAHYAALKAPAHADFSGDVDLTLPATTSTLLSTTSNLADLANVASTAPTTNQVLSWNGTSWTPADASSGGSSTLDGLSDVSASSPSDGQVLKYNATSSQWEAGTDNTSSGGTNADTVDNYHISVVTSLPANPNSSTIYFVTG